VFLTFLILIACLLAFSLFRLSSVICGIDYFCFDVLFPFRFSSGKAVAIAAAIVTNCIISVVWIVESEMMMRR
jgi:hypothetical protein